MKSLEGKKILLLSLSGIGNYLMQSPTIEALRKAYPKSHITLWIAPRGTRTLAKHNPHVNEVIEAPIKKNLMGHLRMIYKLRTTHYNLGIVLSPGQLIKSAAYLFLAGIPQRIGHKYPLFGKEAKLFLTHAIPEDPRLHDIEQNLNLLKTLGISYSPLPTHYSLTIPLSAQKRAEDLISKFQIPTSKRLVGAHPGSAPNFLWKRWPLKHWVELGERLIKKNYHILIFGGADEIKLKRKLQARLGKYSTIIETDLSTTAAIMQKCESFVSNDSGLMHLAAAAGVKTYGLFGPTDEKQTGPRGEDSHAIRAPGTEPVYHTEKNFDLGSQPHETMRALSVEDVLANISR